MKVQTDEIGMCQLWEFVCENCLIKHEMIFELLLKRLEKENEIW